MNKNKLARGRFLVTVVIFVAIALIVPPLIPFPGELSFIEPAIVSFLLLAAAGYLTFVRGKAGLARVIALLLMTVGGGYVLGLQSQKLGFHPGFGWGLAPVITLIMILLSSSGKTRSAPRRVSRSGSEEVSLGDSGMSIQTPTSKWGVNLSELLEAIERNFGHSVATSLNQALGAQNDRFRAFYDAYITAGVSAKDALERAAKAAGIDLPQDPAEVKKQEAASDEDFSGHMKFF